MGADPTRIDLQLRYQKGKFNVVADALSHMPMVNELSFTRFKSSLLESIKGLCEHDTSFAEVWRRVRARNIKMQPPPPSSELSLSPERLIKLSAGRKASVDPKRSNEALGIVSRRRTRR